MYLDLEEQWDGINMKKLLRKIFGIEEMERAIAETQARIEDAERLKNEAIARAEEALKKEEEAKLSPKERASLKGEPWVSVIDTKVNKENVRNGFFELDWNDQFIVELKKSGYGFDGDPDEEIVDRWFRDLARNMLVEEGLDPNRGAGFIDVRKISADKSEVS
jgi:hypothetical protein